MIAVGIAPTQELVSRYGPELGVTMVPFSELVYLPDEDRYEESGKIAPGTRTATLSGTQVRSDFLEKGKPLPEWFTRPELRAAATAILATRVSESVPSGPA